MQPPPRGCVLKHVREEINKDHQYAAASARLCVETIIRQQAALAVSAAAFARLCVETG